MSFYDAIRVGASGAADYEVERSLRFNDGDSAELNKTFSSVGNRKKWTWSAWVKRGNLNGSGTQQTMFSGGSDSSNFTSISIYQDSLTYKRKISGSNDALITTTQKLRDVSSWYHFVVYEDAANTVTKFYINGVEVTDFSSSNQPTNVDGFMNTNQEHAIGNAVNTTEFFDGYMAEINFVDGQAYDPSYFGATDVITGQWNPKKYGGGYGTNGFYLNFSDNSGTTATTLGKDYSGNSNNFTPNNFSVAANLANDSMPDTPTNNFCTLNPLNATSSFNFGAGEGNLVFDQSSNDQAITGTFFITSGKWYWEIYKNSGQNPELGIVPQFAFSAQSDGAGCTTDVAFITNGGNLRNGNNGTASITGGSAQTGAGWIRIAVDMDNKKIWFSDTSGNYFNSGNPATGANAAFDFSSVEVANGWTPYIFMGTGSGHNCYVNFGQFELNSFSSNIPTGFKTLSSANLPDPTILLPNKYFDTFLYTATGNAMSFSGLNFQPDWIWQKSRNSTGSSNVHYTMDAVRGGDKGLVINNTNAEFSGADITFTSNGYDMGASTGGQGNGASNTYVSWNWNGGGSTVTNNDGSISSQVRANTSAGFSIVSYTGTGSNATIGHGLGVAPQTFIVKKRNDSGTNWRVYHHRLNSGSSPENYGLVLNNTFAELDRDDFNDTAPTSTNFAVGTHTSTNNSGHTYIAYCFSEVAGYSKFGSYTGNGNDNGAFVFTGFRPAWLLIKNTSSGSTDWILKDATIETFNVVDAALKANTSDAESSSLSSVDFLSNGFKIRNNGSFTNTNGNTYIYLAFAESPFKNARAR